MAAAHGHARPKRSGRSSFSATLMTSWTLASPSRFGALVASASTDSEEKIPAAAATDGRPRFDHYLQRVLSWSGLPPDPDIPLHRTICRDGPSTEVAANRKPRRILGATKPNQLIVQTVIAAVFRFISRQTSPNMPRPRGGKRGDCHAEIAAPRGIDRTCGAEQNLCRRDNLKKSKIIEPKRCTPQPSHHRAARWQI